MTEQIFTYIYIVCMFFILYAILTRWVWWSSYVSGTRPQHVLVCLH